MKIYVFAVDAARQYLTKREGRELEDEFVEKVLTLKETECRSLAITSEGDDNRLCGIYGGHSFEREFNHDLQGRISSDNVFIRIF